MNLFVTFFSVKWPTIFSSDAEEPANGRRNQNLPDAFPGVSAEQCNPEVDGDEKGQRADDNVKPGEDPRAYIFPNAIPRVHIIILGEALGIHLSTGGVVIIVPEAIPDVTI